MEGVVIGPGGIPLPPPPPIYGSRTTGMHPVGRVVPDWLSRGVSNIRARNNAMFLTAIVAATNIYQRVLNSEGDSKKEEKKTTLENNKSKGKKAEKEVTKELEEEFPDDDVLTQVTGKFEDGSTTVFDDVIVSGKNR